MVFSKTLQFTYKDVGQESFLVFTFDDEKIKDHRMYDDFFPIAWKVEHILPAGQHEFSVTYLQQFAFATAQIDKDKLITDSSVVDIDFQQESTVTGDDQKGYTWSSPKKHDSLKNNEFTGTNDTNRLQHIAICTDPGTGFVQPIMYVDVPVNGVGLVEYVAKLRIYAVTGIQEGQIIRTEVHSPKLFDHNLSEEGLSDKWVITYDKFTGNYKISPAQ